MLTNLCIRYLLGDVKLEDIHEYCNSTEIPLDQLIENQNCSDDKERAYFLLTKVDPKRIEKLGILCQKLDKVFILTLYIESLRNVKEKHYKRVFRVFKTILDSISKLSEHASPKFLLYYFLLRLDHMLLENNIRPEKIISLSNLNIFNDFDDVSKITKIFWGAFNVKISRFLNFANLLSNNYTLAERLIILALFFYGICMDPNQGLRSEKIRQRLWTWSIALAHSFFDGDSDYKSLAIYLEYLPENQIFPISIKNINFNDETKWYDLQHNLDKVAKTILSTYASDNWLVDFETVLWWWSKFWMKDHTDMVISEMYLNPIDHHNIGYFDPSFKQLGLLINNQPYSTKLYSLHDIHTVTGNVVIKFNQPVSLQKDEYHEYWALPMTRILMECRNFLDQYKIEPFFVNVKNIATQANILNYDVVYNTLSIENTTPTLFYAELYGIDNKGKVIHFSPDNPLLEVPSGKVMIYGSTGVGKTALFNHIKDNNSKVIYIDYKYVSETINECNLLLIDDVPEYISQSVRELINRVPNVILSGRKRCMSLDTFNIIELKGLSNDGIESMVSHKRESFIANIYDGYKDYYLKECKDFINYILKSHVISELCRLPGMIQYIDANRGRLQQNLKLSKVSCLNIILIGLLAKYSPRYKITDMLDEHILKSCVEDTDFLGELAMSNILNENPTNIWPGLDFLGLIKINTNQQFEITPYILRDFLAARFLVTYPSHKNIKYIDEPEWNIVKQLREEILSENYRSEHY